MLFPPSDVGSLSCLTELESYCTVFLNSVFKRLFVVCLIINAIFHVCNRLLTKFPDSLLQIRPICVSKLDFLCDHF